MSCNSFLHFNLVNTHINCLHGTARYLTEIIFIVTENCVTPCQLIYICIEHASTKRVMTAPVKTRCIRDCGLRTSRLKFFQISTIPLKPEQNESVSYVPKKKLANTGLEPNTEYNRVHRQKCYPCNSTI